MSLTLFGVLVGLLLALSWAAGGFEFFLLALLLGAVGGFIAAHVEGKIDIRDIFTTRGRG